jgi:hypothetical protein
MHTPGPTEGLRRAHSACRGGVGCSDGGARLGEGTQGEMTLLVGAITASLLAAVVVAVASLWQTPTYEASAKVLVDLHLKSAHGKYA